MNISGYCAAVFENNPHVSNILIQERDLIPNGLLGRYWAYWEGRYDKYINLSESLEGDLLIVEGRPPFYSTKEWRHKRCNRNYYDYTMERGGYPTVTGTRGELFFTEAEERRARKFFDPLRGKFTIVWALNGSSHHKVYPMMEPLLREWFRTHEDARCITVGDYAAKMLEFPHYQVIPRAGEWSIRESLIATKCADCVVGPETMMTNAAGCYDTPKIIFLSHSSRENLTKYFTEDYSLTPNPSTAPCYPCHQLHYSKESCPVGEMEDTGTGAVLGQAPICAISIEPERVMAQLDLIYNKWKGRSHASANAR
jgi:ADP-heptose:LPS heptosyltransferase